MKISIQKIQIFMILLFSVQRAQIVLAVPSLATYEMSITYFVLAGKFLLRVDFFWLEQGCVQTW